MQAPFADPLLGLESLRTALPLVGRETELQLLHFLLDVVAHDLPDGARAATISGDMGSGKTRLLAALCQEARERGFRILEARAYEAGSQFPYFPFIEALRPILRSSTPERLRDYLGLPRLPGLSDPHTTYERDQKDQAEQVAQPVSLLGGSAMLLELARLFPELPARLNIDIFAIQPVTELLTADQQKFRLLDAIATLLERLAYEQPLLLAIDNLQWADSASLELTLYLTMRLRTSRIALVGVTRPLVRAPQSDASADAQVVARTLMDLIRQGSLLPVMLGPLTDHAATQHLQALLPGTISPDVAQTLLARAEGNPFFLEELVRALTAQRHLVQKSDAWHLSQTSSTRLPESIMLAVGQRLQELSTRCRELLYSAALAGRTFPLAALAQALESDVDAIQPLIDEAIQASVLAMLPEEESVAEDELAGLPLQRAIFCQGIVQEALQAAMPAHRARVVHAALGRSLEACYAHEATEHAAELARHYFLGGEQEATLRWSLLAGEDAARKQTHREAISHFRLAVRLLEGNDNLAKRVTHPPLPELYLTIGELWFRLGAIAQAITAFQQALQQTQDASPFLIARANRLLSDSYRMQAHYDQALAHLQVASAAFNEVLATPASRQSNISEHLLFLQSEAVLNAVLNRTQEAEAALQQSHKLATELGDRNGQAFALYWLGWISGWGEQVHRALRLLEQATDLYIAIGDLFRAIVGDQVLGSIYQTLGDMEQARLYTLRGLERARRYGVLLHVSWLHWNQGVMEMTQGNWENSLLHLQQAMQEASVYNDIRIKPLVLQVQAMLQFRRGDWQAAEQLFLESTQAATTLEWLPGAQALYGYFLAVTGRLEAARVQLHRAAEFPEPPGFNGYYYIPFLVEGYMHLNEPERAGMYIERVRKLRGFMYYGASVDRVLGIVAMQANDWQTAEQAFEDALLLCRRANNQPEEAAILYEQAQVALRREAPVQRVHELCDQARTIFLHYGMERAVTMVDTLREGAKQLEQPSQVAAQEASSVSLKISASSGADRFLELHLTKRELEVLRLVAEGHTDREVAETLVISPRTANRHLSNIFIKLDVPGRAAAVAYAIRHGLV